MPLKANIYPTNNVACCRHENCSAIGWDAAYSFGTSHRRKLEWTTRLVLRKADVVVGIITKDGVLRLQFVPEGDIDIEPHQTPDTLGECPICLL